MRTFYKRTIFWANVTKTLALLGPSGGVVVGKYTDDPFWVGVGIASLLLAGVISIWLTDKDNNGIIDLFEDKDK